ncbi:MAG: hypothetical protein AAB563_00245 [Patescibacteria group bacterium]
MVETQLYRSGDYEEFHPLSPEQNDEVLVEARKRFAYELRQTIDPVRGVTGKFTSRSEYGAFMMKMTQRAMQGRVGPLDRAWVSDVKSFFMKIPGSTESSWSGVVSEFAAARVLQATGHVVRFPGNLPDTMPKPSGYNELTQAEQDRLQGIDWWLEMSNFPWAVTVKSMPFTEKGAMENQLLYLLDEDYRSLLPTLINNETVIEGGENVQTPAQRLNDALFAAGRITRAAAGYNAGAIMVLMPSLGNDSNFDRHTGEPSNEIIQACSTRLEQISETMNSNRNFLEGVDHAA